MTLSHMATSVLSLHINGITRFALSSHVFLIQSQSFPCSRGVLLCAVTLHATVSILDAALAMLFVREYNIQAGFDRLKEGNSIIECKSRVVIAYVRIVVTYHKKVFMSILRIRINNK